MAVTQYIIMMLKYINYTESSWVQAITLAPGDLLGWSPKVLLNK
jgi:hypothetical protein